MIQKFRAPEDIQPKLLEKLEDALTAMCSSPTKGIIKDVISSCIGSPAKRGGKNGCSAPSSGADYFDKQTVMESVFTEDFYGLLESKSIAEKKLIVTKIFRLFFRFSLEKLVFFCEDLEFMLVLLQYILDTELSRVHLKDSLAPNATCYYRAVENLINESEYKHHLIDIIRSSPCFEKLNIKLVHHNTGRDRTNEPMVSLASLETMNSMRFKADSLEN